MRYCDDIRDEIDKYTIDSFINNFSEHQLIDDLTFSVLCNAKPYDQRFTALLEFDFDDGKVNVCDNTDGVLLFWFRCGKILKNHKPTFEIYYGC